MRCTILRAGLAAAATLLLAATPAHAFKLRGFEVGLTDPGTLANPTAGASLLTAGAHPDVTISPQFPFKKNPDGSESPDESIKDVDVDLPRGLIFNPTAAPLCSTQDLAADYSAHCPIASQVGVAYVQLSSTFEQAFPIYNIVPPPGVPAEFGFNVVKTTVKLDGRVRSGGDYGLSASARNISQGLPLFGTRIELWGVPADPVHDAQRSTTADSGSQITGSAGVPAKPLTSNPGRCTGRPLRFTADGDSWQTPRASGPVTTSKQRTGGKPLTITGCDSLPFEPAVTVRPTTDQPDSPSGLDVDVSVPQSENPQVPSSAHLQTLSLLLPEGMNVNPSAADGLASCAPDQIALSSASPAACPDASSLGEVTIDTPLLDAPLLGHAYLAKQGDNPFGTTLAMYLEASGSGVVVKLPGRIDADPGTGRLRVTFSDNPELPFSHLRVALAGGPRAPLTTPAACGRQSVAITATPWSGQAAKTLEDGFDVACSAGLGGFAPAFAAGTRSPAAGQYSPLSVSVTRADGQAHLRDISLSLPPGLLAKIGDVPQCPEAQAAAGACDAASRVGSANVTAGAGSSPFPLAGDVFLTGPYRGAPYGLVARVRALAGPLDLGTVVVRQALFIDREDTHVDVVSDPLPTILAGIPIRLRTLDVDVDRPGFTVNPTSCTAKQVTGTLGSAAGQQAPVATRFQVGGCGDLALTPKLALKLVGSGSRLRDGGHPGVRATLTQPAGQSNIGRVEVTLPLSLALDPENAQSLCEYVEGIKGDPQCPQTSIVGTATARTPLLAAPLTGPVYFVKNVRLDPKTGREIKTLPTLVVPLRGAGVQINLRARTSVTKGGRLVTTFDRVPDAPVSSFALSLSGGAHGIVVANTSVCKRSRELGLAFRGQNERLVRSAPQLTASCGRRAARG